MGHDMFDNRWCYRRFPGGFDRLFHPFKRQVHNPARGLDACQGGQGGAQHSQLPGGIAGLAKRAP